MDLYIVALVCMIIAGVTSEPCLTYENFTADSRRSPSHIEPEHDNKICDAVLSTKWYRLVGDAGSDLTNDSSILVSNGCGTSHQLWMNGTIPDVSEGIVDRKICMRSVFSICHRSFTIQVKNCCSFRVYNLRSATNCPQAYCVGHNGIPSVDCPQPTAGTNTGPVEETITIGMTATQTTSDVYDTSTATVNHDTGDKHLTIINGIDPKVFITVIVLLIIIAMTLIGILICKYSKCSKVDMERYSIYCDPIPVHYRRETPEHIYVDVGGPVEKGGENNRTTTYTRHGRELY